MRPIIRAKLNTSSASSLTAFAILAIFNSPKSVLKPTSLFSLVMFCVVSCENLLTMRSAFARNSSEVNVVIPTCVSSTSWSRSRRISASESVSGICMMHRVNGAEYQTHIEAPAGAYEQGAYTHTGQDTFRACGA